MKTKTGKNFNFLYPVDPLPPLTLATVFVSQLLISLLDLQH